MKGLTMSSDKRELRKHAIRRLKTEVYEYESELATLGSDVRKDNEEEEKRRQTVIELILNLRRKLVEVEKRQPPEVHDE
jgi:hypothetical protein